MDDLEVFWLLVAFVGGMIYPWAIGRMFDWVNDRSVIVGTRKEKADGS